VPPGRWELEALELDEPTGVAITNGHQNGENPAAATQSATRVALGPPAFLVTDVSAVMMTPGSGGSALGDSEQVICSPRLSLRNRSSRSRRWLA
jgi:hypothetical protein